MRAPLPRPRRSRRSAAATVLAAVAAVALLPAAPATAAVTPAAPPAWWSYDRPAGHTSVRLPMKVPTRDGTPLACDLTLPADGNAPTPGPHPGVVVEFTPYSGLRFLFNEEAAWLAARGYAALVCNVRGTGASGGTWPGAASAIEARDNYDLIEWMAAQPWSDGRIAQIGHSYGGFTAYRVAALQPPHLVTIVPMQSQANLYDDVIYPGGIKATENGTIDNWPPLAAALSGGRVDPAAEYATNADHPTFDDYWKQVAISTKYDLIEVPVLTFGGYHDSYFRGSALTNHLGVGDNSWAVLGPWTHAQVVAWPGCAVPMCVDHDLVPPGAVLAWLDHWVMERPDAPLPTAPVTSYEGPVGTGAGWREMASWPWFRLAGMTADGVLNGTGGLWSSVSFSQPAEPDEPGGSVSFTTPELTADEVLYGSVLVHLEATLDSTDANLYVELLDVAPDGTATTINDGFLRASHRRSHESPTPAIPGMRTGYDIVVRPVHHRFAAGHRIRLRVSGGPAAALVPNAWPTTVTIHTGLGRSYASLPISP